MDGAVSQVSDLIDTDRYPLGDLGSPRARAVIDAQCRSLAERGVAILPGFVPPAIIERMADETLTHYDAVATVLEGGAPDRVRIVPMTPGTLMLFAGRNSLHRVSPVEGDVPRLGALFAYDTRPDANSTEVFKMVRYGRATPIASS
jgi:hypothetical protein